MNRHINKNFLLLKDNKTIVTMIIMKNKLKIKK